MCTHVLKNGTLTAQGIMLSIQIKPGMMFVDMLDNKSKLVISCDLVQDDSIVEFQLLSSKEVTTERLGKNVKLKRMGYRFMHENL